MKCLTFIVVVAYFGGTICENKFSEKKEKEVEPSNNQGWREVSSDESGWSSYKESQDQSTEQMLRRRRLRKRKRKPPMEISSEDIYQEPSLTHHFNRWMGDVNDDIIRKYRRRGTLINPPEEDSRVTQDATESDTTENYPTYYQQNSISFLKTLLKQSNGSLSLSERLQQQNITLMDLLQNREKALSVLTEKPVAISIPTTKNNHVPKEHKWTLEEINQSSTEMQVQNKIPFEVININKMAKDHTDRTIFVPFHPNYYTLANFKPDFSRIFEQTTEPYFAEPIHKETESSITKPTKYSLPTTNPKLQLITKTLISPFESIKVNVNEVLGHKDEVIKVEENNKQEQPLKIIIPLTKNEPKTTEASMESSEATISYLTAKEEISEILKDVHSRERLSRILHNRNMTLEELVEQRERGSSQVHLADIFHNKTKEPEPAEEPFVGRIESDPVIIISHFERKPKSRTFGNEHNEQSSTASNIKATDISLVETSSLIPLPTVETETKKNIKPVIWKQIYPDFYTEDNANDVIIAPPFEYINNNIQRLAESEDMNFPAVSNEYFKIYEQEISDDTEFINIPSGVKSVILVSFSIIGLSLLVFLTILVVFKWSQKQRKRINYCSSLSAKLRSPMILQGNPTTAIKSFMCETLGSKKNYYKSNVKNVTEEMWDYPVDRKASF